MERNEIIETVNERLREEFEIDGELLPTLRLKDDLDIDSLDVVDVAVLVHEAFGISLSKEELKRVKTLQDLYDVIENISQ